ncbi:hypothetical protein [Halocatena salina]|uniref:Uncharacterized protein n=1 Tax=Halocatena salina TaxID=2934340 RepID=A0A8U0A3Q8_9EURY|nr:hypothetical protein [Halocatena salina]UPM43835.1 hypothetical protein MW046_05165 [Halocatena salina]
MPKVVQWAGLSIEQREERERSKNRSGGDEDAKYVSAYRRADGGSHPEIIGRRSEYCPDTSDHGRDTLGSSGSIPRGKIEREHLLSEGHTTDIGPKTKRTRN